MGVENAKCTKLAFDAAVNLAKDGEDITGFELDGYTGATVERWWGKLAICLDGISCKQKMPIFRDHNSNEIVGFSTETTNTPFFKVKGQFSKSTKAAKDVIALAVEGFPWQASIGVTPKAITELKKGEKMEVNGSDITGPAEIWTQSEVKETSFVPLGADGNTSATVFSYIEEVEEGAIKPTNKKDQNMDIEKLRKEHPDLVAEIVTEATSGHAEALAAAKEDGAKAERERMKAVYDQKFPGFENIVEEAMFDGVSQAGDVAIAINKANLAAMNQHQEESLNEAPEPVDEPVNNMQLDNGPMTKEKLQAKWDKDTKLQAEFGGDFECYLALEMPGDGVKFKTINKRGE